jgi:hypothetical protein
MDWDELIEQIRAMRAKGATPKAIARAVGLTPAQVAPLIRAVAAELEAAAPEPAVVACRVSPGWRTGLTVAGHPEWRDVPDADSGASIGAGLVNVLVAREHRRDRDRVSICGYLVDAYCLGVKNAVGPRSMDRHDLPDFITQYFSAFADPPLAAPLELARHLVFGAIEYARGLGFEPHPDFAAAAGHLGSWTGPSAITFGHHGKPLFVQGPYDDANRVLRTLERSVGHGNFDFLMEVGFGPGLSVRL